MKFDLSNDMDYKRVVTYLKKLFERKDRIEIKKFQEKRTNLQNRYFHVACGILSDWSGYTIDEMKIIIKTNLTFMTYRKGGHTFFVSTADLDKEEFILLVDYTRGFAQDQGCYIPTPEEYQQAQFETEKELNI